MKQLANNNKPLIVEGELDSENAAFTAFTGQPTVYEAMRTYIEDGRRIIIKFDIAGELYWKECTGVMLYGKLGDEHSGHYLNFWQTSESDHDVT